MTDTAARKTSLFSRAPKAAPKNRIEVPQGYAATASWIPQIGDHFPNFWAETTKGALSLHSWAAGRWTFLFSHPCAFSPVCTTELADFAGVSAELAARNVGMLGLTSSTLEDESRWVAEVEEEFDVTVDFPLAADPEGTIERACGIYESSLMPGFMVRRSFLIDPSMRLRMMFEYPAAIGRSTDELLRVIDALQTSDEHKVGIPSDWRPGATCLLSPNVSDTQAASLYPDRWARINNYLRVVDVASAA